MRRTRIWNEIRVIGKIWQPGDTCAMCYHPENSEIESMKYEHGALTRKSIEHWINSHSGDFQSIEDFYANITQDDVDLEFPWILEESEDTYSNCMT